MHVLQWIAIEANDEDEAVANVTSELEVAMGDGENYISWYDWFVVGGGRWNTEEGDGIMSGYTPKTNMVISYDKDPNGFRARVDKCIQNRIDTYNEYLTEVKKYDILAKLETYGGVMEYDPMFYSLSSLVKMKSGDWTYDSWFYDFIADSSNATHILSKLDKHDQDTPKVAAGIFLVPVDFHF